MTRLIQDIRREPDELTAILAYFSGDGRSALEAAAEIIRACSHVYLTGIGSSWHAGMSVLSFLSAHGRAASLWDASELLHFGELPPDSVVIVLSRSGKSVEIVRQLKKLPSLRAKLIAVTNTPGSPLARQADVCLDLHADFDHLVSVTMYSGLALAGSLLAATALGGSLGHLIETLKESLGASRRVLAQWEHEIANSDWLAAESVTYFLARGGSLSSCHEARLLWEEAAKAPATALSTGSFRHGPQEVVRPGLRVGMWLDGAKLRTEDLTLAKDLRGHGAKVLLIGQELAADAADLVVNIPAIPAAWQFLIDIIPAQLAVERLARLRGVDCDSFRICPYIVEQEGGLSTSASK